MLPITRSKNTVQVDGVNTSLTTLTFQTYNNPIGYCMDKKIVSFVVDISASMSSVMPELKASLLTFRDLICRKINAGNVTDEQFKICLPNFNLITFSDTAKIVWSSFEKEFPKSSDFENFPSFTDCVDGLEVECSTNMGDGIEQAYKLCSTSHANWIVILTDGESNKGKYQTIGSFTKLESQKPPNTKIITLGYGDDFNVDILNAIGDFTYLENAESIPAFMGTLSHEILTCSVFGLRVDFHPEPVSLFGTQEIGNFGNERKYLLSFTGDDEIAKIRVKFLVIYEDLGLLNPTNGVSEVVFDFSIEICPNIEIPNEDIQLSVINYQSSILIKELYACDKRLLNKKIDEIRNKIKTWPFEEARETIERICNEMINARCNHVAAPKGLQTANSMQTQTSYTDQTYLTPSSAIALKKGVDISNSYLKKILDFDSPK